MYSQSNPHIKPLVVALALAELGALLGLRGGVVGDARGQVVDVVVAEADRLGLLARRLLAEAGVVVVGAGLDKNSNNNTATNNNNHTINTSTTTTSTNHNNRIS